MGHEIQFMSFDYKMSRKDILDEADDVYDRNCEYGGSTGGIDFRDITPLGSYDEAEGYLEKIASDKFYYQGAVPYLYLKELKPSAKLTKLRGQFNDALENYNEQCSKNYLSTLSAKFVTCKHCESKINREIHAKHYSNAKCPVCNEDLRPATWLSKIETAGKKVDTLRDAVKAEEKVCREKQKKNAVKKWLVRIEYHV